MREIEEASNGDEKQAAATTRTKQTYMLHYTVPREKTVCVCVCVCVQPNAYIFSKTTRESIKCFFSLLYTRQYPSRRDKRNRKTIKARRRHTCVHDFILLGKGKRTIETKRSKVTFPCSKGLVIYIVKFKRKSLILYGSAHESRAPCSL